MFKRNYNIEATLLKGLKKSRPDCFKRLFDAYSQPLFRFSLGYLKSEEEAEDVVQEVFLKIWKKRKEIDTAKSFNSYIFTIALNSIRKHFNELAVEHHLKHDILTSIHDDHEVVDEYEDYEELLEKLELAIGKMPLRRREIFLRKKIDCKSLKEISEEYNISIKTVEYHITEAMKFLKGSFIDGEKKRLII